ncbi:N-6 DNA methylase [candidate division KSB1 bacterium]|nr:N-6 DNA methylase [candidate division KSB1 bacterium]
MILLETVCKNLYTDHNFHYDSLNALRTEGIRIVLWAFYNYLARRKRKNISTISRLFPIHIEKIEPALEEFLDSIFRNEVDEEEPIGPGFPGMLYGEFLRYALKEGKNGELSLEKDRSRRKSGTFYTPESITRFIVRETITPLVENKSPGEIRKIKVCDPAMGTGNFLKAAAEFLTESALSAEGDKEGEKRSELYKWIVSHCLFGVDKDPTAVAVSKAYFVITADLKYRDLEHFLVADTLIDDLPAGWMFDAVIGNPPWLTYGLRDVKKIPGPINTLYRRKYPNTAEYKISAYAIFIERALSITRPDGYHSFIVPDSWLTGRFFSKLRKFLLSRTSILKIVLIKKDFWIDLHIGRSVIYIVKNSARQDNGGNIDACIVENPDDLRFAGRNNVFISTNRIQKRFRRRIVVYPDEYSRKIVEKMEDKGEALGIHLKFYSGLIGRDGKKSILINPGEHKDVLLNNIPRSRIIESGKHLAKDRITYTGCYILDDPLLYKSGYNVAKYRNPKIFINQTGFTLKAYYDEMGFFCLNNMHIAFPEKGEAVDLRFYSALLNSKILNFFYKIVSMEDGRTFAQTDIDFLRQLPHGTDRSIVEKIISVLETFQEKKVIHSPSGSTDYLSILPEERQEEIEYLFAEWYSVPGFDFSRDNR